MRVRSWVWLIVVTLLVGSVPAASAAVPSPQAVSAKADVASSYVMVNDWPTQSHPSPLTGPMSMSFDQHGQLFVADYNVGQVLEFSSDGAYLTAVPTATIECDTAALDFSGDIYVGDGNAGKIRHYTADGTSVASWGSYGTGTGQIFWPRAMAVHDGYVDVADNVGRIQRFTTSGTYVTGWSAAGGKKFGLIGDIQVRSGALWVSDPQNKRIVKMTAAGAYVTSWSVPSPPDGVDLDAAGHVFAMCEDGLVREYGSTGALIRSWATPFGVTIDSDPCRHVKVDAAGAIWVSDLHRGIVKYGSPGVQAFAMIKGGTSDGEFNGVNSVSADVFGNVWASDVRVQRFGTYGTFLSKWWLSDLGEPRVPQGVAAGPNGSVYVTYMDGAVLRCDQQGHVLARYAPSDGYPDRVLGNLTVDASGTVYAAVSSNVGPQFCGVLKLTADLKPVGTFGTGSLTDPRDVAVDAAGNMYVADYSRVVELAPDGSLVTSWKTTKGAFGVGADPDGSVFVAEQDRIEKYSPAGQLICTLGQSDDEVQRPMGAMGVCVDQYGDVYVADTYRIMKFAPVEGGVVPPVERIAGGDRYTTSVEIARSQFTTAGTVVLVTGQDFPDALSASALAGVDDAPLLLTTTYALPGAVKNAILSLKPKKAVIIGSTKVVSSDVEAGLKSMGLSVSRIGGADRYQTAALVTAEVKKVRGSVPGVFVVRGDRFPDGLAAGPFACRSGIPILLTRPTALPSVTASSLASLGVTEAVIAGSELAVSSSVATEVAGICGSTVRCGGQTSIDTAAALARLGISRGWGGAAGVGIATNATFPDALSGGVAAGKEDGSLLLVGTSGVPTSVADFLGDYRGDISRVSIFGGLPAVSLSTQDGLTRLMQ